MRARARRVGLVGAVLIATLAAVSACSSGATTATATAPSSPAAPSASGSMSTMAMMVQVVNFAFKPQTITVPVGGTVTWKFVDSVDHTVSANDKSFMSPPLSGGKTWSHTFTKAGSFPYICSIHPFMTGTVTVK